jgi:hypothetical protein
MADRPPPPDDPGEFLRACVRGRRIVWTYHVAMRIQRRCLSRDVILDAVESYEVIESYSEDKYLPSYLVRAEHGPDVVHVLFAADSASRSAHVVTAYAPDPSKWLPGLRQRRRTP